MNTYYTTTPVVTRWTTPGGLVKEELDAKAVEGFKIGVESYLNQLGSAVAVLQSVNVLADRTLQDFRGFMAWMQQAHPDIIEAYTKSKQVQAVLDKANNEELIYPQAAA